MKKTVSSIVALAAAAIFSASAHAVVVLGNGGATLTGVLDGIHVDGSTDIDVNNDQLGGDDTWGITGAGGSFSQIVIELAGFANQNTFGIYDATDPTKRVELFNGAASAGAKSVLSLAADGSVEVNLVDTGIDFAGNAFGYYLQTPQLCGPLLMNCVYFTDDSLNPDGVDHTVVYQGTNSEQIQLPNSLPGTWTDNEYLFGWEDLRGGGDRDYADFVVMIESIERVPAPATLVLFTLGLLGFAMRRKA